MLFMGSTEALDVFRLFQRSAPVRLLRELSRKHGYGLREGIYGAGVVIWLMIWQRLQGSRSQQAAVQYLLQGGADEMQIDCKRWNEDRVSASSGSYSTARQRLPGPIVREVTERMVAQLRVEMEEGWEGLQRPVFVVDGTTLQLQHEPDLVKAYCPGRNQHGENHWPVMQVLVMHDVYSGMAVAPSWGPMYGDAAVSEQAMAVAALDKLPPDAALLGDANFGVFAFAYAVHRSGRPTILRLSQPRAKNILGEALKEGTDRKLVWRPRLWDRKSHPELPGQACVEGRVLVFRHPCCQDELLCLFTTLELPTEQLLGIYKLRWRVETDLRSLKRTVGIHQLRSKSPDMVEKELLLAIAAYNLIRAVMCLAARRAGIEPRQLSFSFVQSVVEAALPGLDHASSDEEYRQRLERMLRFAAQGRLPRRTRQRGYPREVWGRGAKFPARKRSTKSEGVAK
jgi:Transposase DDE domain